MNLNYHAMSKSTRMAALTGHPFLCRAATLPQVNECRIHHFQPLTGTMNCHLDHSRALPHLSASTTSSARPTAPFSRTHHRQHQRRKLPRSTPARRHISALCSQPPAPQPLNPFPIPQRPPQHPPEHNPPSPLAAKSQRPHNDTAHAVRRRVADHPRVLFRIIRRPRLPRPDEHPAAVGDFDSAVETVEGHVFESAAVGSG